MLEQLLETERFARDFGFDWPDFATIVRQALSECQEIAEAWDAKEGKARLEEEVGDLLHCVVSMCCFAGLDPAVIAAKTSTKFSERMQLLAKLTRDSGRDNLKGASYDYMLELWEQVKVLEKSAPTQAESR